MGIAAHKQWDDVEMLLRCLHDSLNGEVLQQVEKIRKRHEAYREAAKGRTDMIFP
jgi:hypothetical protein